MKIFLRVQTNKKGISNRRTKNFITIGLNVFKQFVDELNGYNIAMADYILRFLMETAQKPCI